MASSHAALGDARGDRNMPWLAPGRLMVIEVPDVGGWAGALLGRHWSGRTRFKIRHAAPA